MPKKIKKTKSKPPSESPDFPPLPDRRAIEGMMAGLFGGLTGKGGAEDKKFAAQDLVYQAVEEADWKRRMAMARQALEIDPDCADAYVLLAEETATTIWSGA